MLLAWFWGALLVFCQREERRASFGDLAGVFSGSGERAVSAGGLAGPWVAAVRSGEFW